MGQGIPGPVSNNSLTGTQYQLEKYMKHTTPTAVYGINSIFSDSSFEAYNNYMVDTTVSGWYEIDQYNRVNMIYYAGSPLGFTLQNGIYLNDNRSVRVVLYDDQYKIHGFPAGIPNIVERRCTRCDAAIPYEVGLIE